MGYSVPVRKKYNIDCKYDIYPTFRIEDDRIFSGYNSLIARIKEARQITIDGYCGVFFDEIRSQISRILHNEDFTTSWINTSDLFKTQEEIREMSKPFLGGDDPLFGKRTTLLLKDFFDPGKIESALSQPSADYNFIIGPGASLASWEGLLLYADVPKNEIQQRARRGLITNLGISDAAGPKEMYKLFYFIDWIVLNMHKKEILPRIDVFIDLQTRGMPVWTDGNTLRESIARMSCNFFRARPWFEPGPWGGSWIKDHIDGIDKNAPNYAWSFELISPENGLIIESSSLLCEFSFDLLMYQEAEAVLGECYPRFGNEFPIRFDYLDTFDGGNLSLQCHPGLDYIKENFGEDFTQEEAYYILDTKKDGSVFLGFTEEIAEKDFRDVFEDSFKTGKRIDPENYVQRHSANKHDFFLIPPGTIHGSGKNNLVLEISSTPYIFTFKMYDWLRPDLDGRPRPLNIKRGMDNLRFDRKGDYVKEHLLSHPKLLEEGSDWQIWHLPTHEDHLYDVKRFHFMTTIEIRGENKCLVLNLVEGKCIEVTSSSGYTQNFSYAETFIIPAVAPVTKIKNLSGCEAFLIVAFVK